MDSRRATRREILQAGMSLAGSSLLTQLFPRKLAYPANLGPAQQAASVPADRAAAFREQVGSIPIQAQKLADHITMLSGPGGNVAELGGPDGKVVVDTFVSPAWPKLKETLEGMGKLR